MRVICCYCGKVIKEDDGNGGLDSHGACEDCLKIQFEMIDKM